MNVTSCAVLSTLVIAMTTSGVAALAQPPTPVLDDPDVREYGAAAAEGYLVWSQSDDTGWNSFVKTSSSREIVRMGRTSGNSLWATIDGTTAMYTRLRPDRHFELRFYDVRSGESSAPPAGVNTRLSEEDPSLSGEWLLFTRRTAFGNPRDDRLARVILFNLSTGEHRVLMRLGTKRHYLTTGQVNGDWATWETCDGRIASGTWSNCQVHRYRISTRETQVLPNAGAQQYGAGVTSDGTACLGRSGWSSEWHCGANVRIVRVSPSGATGVIARLPSGIDTGSIFAFEEADGSTTLYLDRWSCRTGESDVYRIDLPASGAER